MYEIRDNCVDTFKDFVFIVAQRFIWTERDILDYTVTHTHTHERRRLEFQIKREHTKRGSQMVGRSRTAGDAR